MVVVVVTLLMLFLLSWLLPCRASIRVLARKVFRGEPAAFFGVDANLLVIYNIWKKFSFSLSPC